MAELLPPLEIVEGQSSGAGVAETPESSLRRRISTDYAGPDMFGRGERFSRDMDVFAERARATGLSDNEVSETYRQIGRIFDAGPTATLSHAQRLALASQVMHNAAYPTEIRQNENTCNVASLEVRTYTRQPSAAAALVADVASSGSFCGHDGTTVRLDSRSLTPSVLGTVDLFQEVRRRNFASQIFQVTAANIANIRDPDFRSLRYEQRPPAARGDMGEALVDTRNGRTVQHEPGAAGRPNGLIAANESITGRRNDGASFLVNLERRGRTSTRAGVFSNAEELGQRLETLSRSGQLPAIVSVHANSDLFPQSPGEIPSDPFNDGHFVSVTGYDPVTRTVRYDDQYGPADDHNDRPVSLQSFYDATHVVRANALLDRLVSARANMTADAFAQNLTQLSRAYAQRWQQVQTTGGTSYSQDVLADRESALQRIAALARELTPFQRQSVETALRVRTRAGR